MCSVDCLISLKIPDDDEIFVCIFSFFSRHDVMGEVNMPGQDQESFHLLQISESQSDSLPDLDLVTVNTQHKKKKVRLKRYGMVVVLNKRT